MIKEDHNGLKIGELPELHIVAIEEITFHEKADMERVARLVERFSQDGTLKNPPIVARAKGTTKRILLDGANRMTALQKLDYPHVLVQEVELADPGLRLEHWHHAVEHLTRHELLQHGERVDGVHIEESDPAPARREILCQLQFADRSFVSLRGAPDFITRVRQLHHFIECYHRFSNMDRVSYTNLEHLQRNYRNFTALVTFTPFTKEDLLTLTQHGMLLPSGITRIVLPKRALRFNLRLDVLRSHLSLEDKNLWLDETIQEMIADKTIRFYREPTFLFDE